MPDRDTWAIWYCLVAFGVLISVVLWGLAGVHLLFTIWFTVPICFVLGHFALNRWMRSIDRRIKAATTPIGESVVGGLGTLRQFAEHWELDLKVRDPPAGR